MEKGVKQSIKVRRNALYNHYDLPPDARARAEELFGRMEELGCGCADQVEFETRFAASPLTGEYNALFADFARYVRLPAGVPTPEEHRRDVAASQAQSVVRGQAERAVKSAIVRAMPKELYDLRTYGVYNIPVIGRLFSAMNTGNVLGRLFRRRPKQQ